MNVKGSVLSHFTATLASPESFVGRNLFYRFDLTLSEAVAIPFQDMRDHAFSVTNGYMAEAKRIHKDRRTEGGQQRLYSNHWRMTVVADDETKPVTVTLRGNRPCSEQGALCDGTVQLTSPPVLTLTPDTAPFDGSNLPSLSIANASATEDTSVLNFDVTLSRATQSRIAFDYRTIAGGTATANADYRPVVDTTKFIRPGETTVAAPVGLIEDTASDAGETVKVEISNARVVTDRGTAFGPLTITTAEATGTIDAPTTSTTAVPNVNLRIENTSMRERNGFMHFTVTLSRPLEDNVCYDFETLTTGTATEGEDFLARPKATQWQQAGVTEWTEFVYILDDAINDPGETVKVEISNAELCNDASKTINIGRAQATGTITNSDPMLQAWLARFGRTVADQVLGAVEGRMSAPRTGGTELTLGGQRIGSAAAAGVEEPEPAHAGAGLEALADWLQGENDDDALRFETRAVTEREMLTGSSFAFTAGSAEGGFGALWGRAAVSSFDGRDDDLTLDGEVTSKMLGADWVARRGSAGLVFSHSRGEGGYRSEAGDGAVKSTLRGLYPWVRYEVSERLALWGVVGYGTGTLTLTPEGVAPMETDMDLRMAAVGGRSVLVAAPATGGLELAVTSDAMMVRTSSEAVQGSSGSLAVSDAGVTRLRLGLEGMWRLALGGEAGLTPSFEIGVRQEGGDAETDAGVDVGAGLIWSDPSQGIRAEFSARGLLTHDDGGFRERGFAGSLAWDPDPASERGPSLTIRQTVGAEASGGKDALLDPAGSARLFAAAGAVGDDLQRRTLEARLGYGFAMFGGGWTGIPELGLGLTEASREYIHAWRLVEGRNAGLAFGLDLEGARREGVSDAAEAEHRVGLGFGWRLVGAQAAGLDFGVRFEGSRQIAANGDAAPDDRLGVRLNARW